jgi:hypothetical protein
LILPVAIDKQSHDALHSRADRLSVPSASAIPAVTSYDI